MPPLRDVHTLARPYCCNTPSGIKILSCFVAHMLVTATTPRCSHPSQIVLLQHAERHQDSQLIRGSHVGHSHHSRIRRGGNARAYDTPATDPSRPGQLKPRTKTSQNLASRVCDNILTTGSLNFVTWLDNILR
ncbi:hypothetical protein J6590_066837 [Homalodisca vitripennis]|nr:hypothetical protein J6590_066837 [Homalodisca vitripennis]